MFCTICNKHKAQLRVMGMTFVLQLFGHKGNKEFCPDDGKVKGLPKLFMAHECLNKFHGNPWLKILVLQHH